MEFRTCLQYFRKFIDVACRNYINIMTEVQTRFY